MNSSKSLRAFQQLRAVIAFLEAKYSISPRHKADVDECFERLEDALRQSAVSARSRVH